MRAPRVCILRADGTNCDVETFYAFEKYGSVPEYVQMNELRTKEKNLQDYQILVLPGGFSYGDDIASGKIWAVELTSFLKDELEKFRAKGGLIIGICNGFQVLVRTGLLPFGFAQGKPFGKMDATLAPNDSGHFECRWVRVRLEKSRCVFLNKNFTFEEPMQSPRRWPEDSFEVGKGIFELSVNHGEGKFLANTETLKKIEAQRLVVFRYIDNPNGSVNNIAGVCDPTGQVLGLMPHPEKFVDTTQYPNWRRDKITEPHGAFFFEEMIKFVKQT